VEAVRVEEERRVERLEVLREQPRGVEHFVAPGVDPVDLGTGFDEE
jgi:hypothetical protein